MARTSRRTVLAASAALFARPALVAAQAPILPPDGSLRPGRFAWQPELSPRGPVMVLVSLAEQLARVYRNGLEIGVSTASTGRPGHATPTGVFTILQKARVHHSSTYDEASMPYTERLTWDGVALHAGGVPGYPSSHGCVHLPLEFARLLFGVTEVGTTVLIADAHAGPLDVVHAGLVLPTTELPAGAGRYEWRPERSPSGPLSLLLSVADRKLYAYRNGDEIGSAAASFARPEEPILPAVFVRLDRKPPTWSQVGLFDAKSPPVPSDILDRL
ncbi:MAG TPA: L,D-transpeptidase family protein, partial [Geminicoccaceae bacterium]|nr:L,D-transpeptidase family protein [Geminicoccaceae bacterium]